MLINISGSSGVGKTTIAKLLYFVLINKNTSVIHLCGDDLHKWERNHPSWNTYTHLNPYANHIDTGTEQILSLLKGDKIYRRSYNHDTGLIDEPPRTILPHNIIINEGLHSLYDKTICKEATINIFVDTDDTLKTKWKIKRDTEKRGYTKSQVVDTINRRKIDEKKYIQPQKKNSDVILRFYEKDGKVCLDASNNNFETINEVLRFYYLHRSFVECCKDASECYDLVQGSGGNVSYKFNNKTIITASGYSFDSVSFLDGFSIVFNNNVNIDNSQLKASMETSLHNKIKNKCILHTHPVYLNAILCSKESKQLCKTLFKKSFNYKYVDYLTPGKDLADNFNPKKSNICLLENHGLFVSNNDFKSVFTDSLSINMFCKSWFNTNIKKFKPVELYKNNKKSKKYLYPDAAVLPREHYRLNTYMVELQEQAGLTPNFLTLKEINKLKNMDDEKYRIKLK